MKKFDPHNLNSIIHYASTEIPSDHKMNLTIEKDKISLTLTWEKIDLIEIFGVSSEQLNSKILQLLDIAKG